LFQFKLMADLNRYALFTVSIHVYREQ